MKRLLVLCLPLLVAGCSTMISTTEREPIFPTFVTYPITTNVAPIAFKETTHLRIRTLFDANAEVAKFSNRSGYNAHGTWGPGTYAAGVNDSSSGSNVVAILHELGNIAGQAAAAASK